MIQQEAPSFIASCSRDSHPHSDKALNLCRRITIASYLVLSGSGHGNGESAEFESEWAGIVEVPDNVYMWTAQTVTTCNSDHPQYADSSMKWRWSSLPLTTLSRPTPPQGCSVSPSTKRAFCIAQPLDGTPNRQNNSLGQRVTVSAGASQLEPKAQVTS